MRWLALFSLVCLGCGAGAPSAPPPTPTPAMPAGNASGHLLDDVRQVSAGTTHTCALRNDGNVWCWGDNALGQLGDASRRSSHVPVRVRALPPARWVAAGAHSTCAVTLEGEVYCWGANSVGQLGNGETATGRPSPVRVARVEGALEAVGSDVAERHCAIDGERTLACWGRLGLFGEDGRAVIGSRVPEPERRLRVLAVAIGASHECALSEDGLVWCRGRGAHGELGRASTTPATRFVRVPGLERVVSIAAGARHTCAVQADGTAWCWGDNAQGQLGIGGRAPFTVPSRVALPVAVRAIVAGHEHTCALGEQSNVYCWGANTQRQLGDGSAQPRTAPQVVRTRALVDGLTAGARHTCALLASGEVQCWGDNGGGQLGDGTVRHRGWPVAVLRGPHVRERVAAH